MDSSLVAKRPHSERARRGGVPPSTLAPPHRGPGGDTGRGAAGGPARGAPRGQSWRRLGARSAARASQRPHRAVCAHRARPAMAADTLPRRPRPRPLPLLLLPLLLLRVGLVRADSKVCTAFGPGRSLVGSWARGGAVAGGTHQRRCLRPGAEDLERERPDFGLKTLKPLGPRPWERST